MEEEHAKHTIAVNATEGKRLSLSKMYEPKDEGKKQKEHAGRTQETLLLTNSTEMKSVSCSGTNFSLVCVPLRKPLPLRPPDPMAISL